MLIFTLGVTLVTLIFEREAQPFLNPETSTSCYIFQWQVVFLARGLSMLLRLGFTRAFV